MEVVEVVGKMVIKAVAVEELVDILVMVVMVVMDLVVLQLMDQAVEVEVLEV